MQPHYVDCLIAEDVLAELSPEDLAKRYLHPMAVALKIHTDQAGPPSCHTVLLRLSLRDCPEEMIQETEET